MIRLFNKMDKTLLFLTLFMFIFGLFMIFDASSMRSFIDYGVNTKYFTKQLVILIISFFASIYIILKPTSKYKFIIYPAIIGIIGMLSWLLIGGTATNSSKSWIYIMGFGLQPSELGKVVIIVFISFYYKINAKRLNRWVPALVPMVVGAIFTMLTLLQPDGGTGMILFFLIVSLFYVSPVSQEIKIKTTLMGFGFVILVGFILLVTGFSPLSKMQQSRFNYKKPCTRYQEDTGYQVCNGYIAINNGKIFSIDPGNSKQKYLYLPEAYTDFIFPIIVEEMGLVTGILAILIYMIIIYRILVISRRSPDIMNSMICYGVACYIFLHVVINLNGVLGILPLTGVPLPFLSYGGSFALTLSVALAIVQRISIENYDYMKKRVLN